jgi:hypothetical protein
MSTLYLIIVPIDLTAFLRYLGRHWIDRRFDEIVFHHVSCLFYFCGTRRTSYCRDYLTYSSCPYISLNSSHAVRFQVFEIQF